MTTANFPTKALFIIKLVLCSFKQKCKIRLYFDWFKVSKYFYGKAANRSTWHDCQFIKSRWSKWWFQHKWWIVFYFWHLVTRFELVGELKWVPKKSPWLEVNGFRRTTDYLTASRDTRVLVSHKKPVRAFCSPF